MSASTEQITVPSEAAAVARRYRRIERPLSWGLALLIGTVAAIAIVRFPLLPAIIAAVVVLVSFRVPIFRTSGTARLTTDADPDTVRGDFESTCPPPLALQWGTADDVRSTENGGDYTFSYLFGLRSAQMRAEGRSRAADGHEANGDLELVVTVGGRPWGTYTASIRDRDGTTVVDLEWDSDRRFGLRRLPQWLVARRYQTEALSAQGYTVVDRDATLSL